VLKKKKTTLLSIVMQLGKFRSAWFKDRREGLDVAWTNTTSKLEGTWTLFFQHFVLTWHGWQHDSCTNKTENKDRMRFFP
jgi:hypothetical protein